MKQKEINIYTALTVIAIIVLTPFIKTGLISGDDLEFFIAGVKGNLTSTSEAYAHTAGRFYFLLTLPFYKLPYTLNNLILTNSINILFIAFGILLLGAITGKLTKNKWLGFLSIALFLSFVTVKGWSNPITHFRWYFSFSFDLLLLAYYLILCYRSNSKIKFLIFSAAFYTVALIFYEVYLLYLPLFIYASLELKHYTDNRSFTSKAILILRNSWPFITIACIYVLVYFGYRKFYPAEYAGTSFAPDFKIVDGFQTILDLARGSYPCYNIADNKGAFFEASEQLFNFYSNLGEFVRTMKPIMWLKGITISVISVYLLKRLKPVKIISSLILLVVSVLYVYIPHLPLALSYKYTYQYPGLSNYITSYFGYFAVIVVIAVLMSFTSLVKINWLKRVVIGILACVLLVGSLITDYINHTTVKGQRQPYYRLKCIDKLIETEEFLMLPEKSNVISPNLYSNNSVARRHSFRFNWVDYIYPKTGKKVYFLKGKNKLIASMDMGQTNNYYLKYDYNYKSYDQFMALGFLSENSKIDSVNSTYLADSITCFYYSDDKEYTISFGIESEQSPPFNYFVNGQLFKTNSAFVSITCKHENFKQYFLPVKIVVDNINMESVSISSLRGFRKPDIVLK